MAEAVQAPVLSDETAKAGAPPPARIFVALKLAPALAEALAVLAAPLKRFGVNPIAPADIHLTLVPPWNEAAIPDAIDKLRQAAARCVPFTLAIDQIAYGPERRWPRLLWAECVPSAELSDLHAALLAVFGQADPRPFRPHVTLARIRGNGARIARKQPIEQVVALAQPVETVELMQSPPPGERGYRVLASLRLGKEPAA